MRESINKRKASLNKEEANEDDKIKEDAAESIKEIIKLS